MKSDELPDQPLSDDPEENLRMENELMKLKMQAELGAQSHSFSELDPVIENEFLKNAMAFEQNFAKARPAKVFDLLGNPDFKRADSLNDEEIALELEWLTNLLVEKSIEVYFGDDDEYDSRTRYSFIAEELFNHETSFPPMPGMTTYFDYEEFHPNHKKDIEKHALKFLSAWIEKDIEGCGWELAHHAILPDKKILSKAEVITQIEHIFSFSLGFTDAKHELFDIGFDLSAGMGHAEGGVKYSVALKNGETVPIGGAFKLYFSLESGYWSIVYMILPGFKYP